MQQVIFSCPGILQPQFPASWMAGIALAMLTGAGAGLRLLLAGDRAGAAAWLSGAVFVPSLALSLGVWSGTSKFFEGLYTALWYLGPMNHAPGFDYTGSLGGGPALHSAGLVLCHQRAVAGAGVFAATVGMEHEVEKLSALRKVIF